ncbi:MAG TPA: transporter [archaeon]|nr:transporter [archaeon]
MRKLAGVLLVASVLAGTLFSNAFAQLEKGHYVCGVEGIKAASLPPPGFYWRLYNAFYNSDKLTDKNGDELPVGFDVSVYALVNRFIYVSDKKILGANYAFDVIVPLINTDLEIDKMGLKDNKFGLADVVVEPFILSWHGPRYDAAFGLGFYAPIGQYDVAKPASPGQDFWSLLITFGGTAYLDEAKTLSASVLSRTEMHSEKSETKVKPGSDFLIEWGLAKTVAKFWDIGLSGYCQWQLTDDSGTGVVWDKTVHDRNYAIGPEVSVFVPSAKLFLSARSLWEFGVVDRSQGNMIAITLTKIL